MPTLHFGRQHIDVTFAENQLAAAHRHPPAPPLADPAAAVRDALESPLGFPALRRALTPDDHVTVVIDEHLARTRFPGEDPIGKRLKLGGGAYEIIGVVGHVVNYGLGQTEAAQDQIYISWRQFPSQFFVAVNHFIQVTLRAQPGIEPTSLIAPAGAAVSGIDAEQPVF